jgi:hypothetical protein
MELEAQQEISLIGYWVLPKESVMLNLKKSTVEG